MLVAAGGRGVYGGWWRRREERRRGIVRAMAHNSQLVLWGEVLSFLAREGKGKGFGVRDIEGGNGYIGKGNKWNF